MPAVDSPCTKICTLDPRRQICIGCGRTPGEIERWLLFSADERKAVMALARQRLERHAPPSQSFA